MNIASKSNSLLKSANFWGCVALCCAVVGAVSSGVKGIAAITSNSQPSLLMPREPILANLDTLDGCFYRASFSYAFMPPRPMKYLAADIECLDNADMASVRKGQFSDSAQAKIKQASDVFAAERLVYNNKLVKLEESRQFSLKYPTSAWQRFFARQELDLNDGQFYYSATETIPRHVNLAKEALTGADLQLAKNKRQANRVNTRALN